MNGKKNLVEYVEKLYNAALLKTRDPYAAEDIVQETFLIAVQNMKKGKTPENLWGWLSAVMSNKYSDWLREKYRKPQISFEEFPFEMPDENEMDDDDSAEKLESIRRELGYLARTHREVMVRFYIHGHTIEKIACDLGIPAGTVKSRLNSGRRHIRERVKSMENYTKQSYQPDVLYIACSGGTGIDDEPFSLVDNTDRLTQNVLILSYEKPVTESELAMALGVPAAFIEPIVEKMVQGELMKRMDNGKVYTDFIIYTEKDRIATVDKQLAVVEEHFDLFWGETEGALSRLRDKDWYKRQPEHARMKLELHFLIKLLMSAHIHVRDEVAGTMPYSEYPYRKNGGRWLAIGNQYPADYDFHRDSAFRKYSVNGEFGAEFGNFRDTEAVELRGYSTSLGQYPGYYLKERYVKWLFELSRSIAREGSEVEAQFLETAGEMVEEGVLKRDGGLALDIPILTAAEYREECRLAGSLAEKLSREIRQVLLPMFDSGYVKLPAHLKSVPKWQQYMLCGDSIPMAVIYKAIEEKRIFEAVNYKLPAVILLRK